MEFLQNWMSDKLVELLYLFEESEGHCFSH